MSPEVDGKIYSFSPEGQNDPQFPRELVNTITQDTIFIGQEGGLLTEYGSTLQAVQMRFRSRDDEDFYGKVTPEKKEEDEKELTAMTEAIGLPVDSPYWYGAVFPRLNKIVEQRGNDITNAISYDYQQTKKIDDTEEIMTKSQQSAAD